MSLLHTFLIATPRQARRKSSLTRYQIVLANMGRLTNREIDEIEKSFGLTLPGLYRKLLFEIGFGGCEHRPNGELNPSKIIFHPEEVRELSAVFFKDQSTLFHPYFPFGHNNDTQELWVIDSIAERAASISNRTVPADWPEEEWLEYHAWVARFMDDENGV